MRRLLPDPSGHLDVDALYAGLTLPSAGRKPDGSWRPWVAGDMVASADGAAAVDGHTEALGGDADQVAFHRLRDACDAILVGAGTLRIEGYGPATGTATRRREREARGLAPTPRLVVVTNVLGLEPGHRAFSDPDHPPLVVAPAAAPDERAERLDGLAEVVRIGHDTVDLHGLLDHLGARGYGRVLCEGGPRLNHALLTEDLLDELFLTLTPMLAGTAAPRIVDGLGTLQRALQLVELHEHGGELLLRYRVVR